MDELAPSIETEHKLKTFMESLRQNLLEFHNLENYEIVQNIIGAIISLCLFMYSLYLKHQMNVQIIANVKPGNVEPAAIAGNTGPNVNELNEDDRGIQH